MTWARPVFCRKEAGMSVTLREIRESDLEMIMNWRMAPDITRYMNTDPRLTLEGQHRWLEAVQTNPDVCYWMILVDGQEAGVINLTGLSREDGVLGWAYYVGEKKLRSLKTALSLEMSLYDYIFDELHREALISDVFTLNKGVIQLHLLCGCEILEEKKAQICKGGELYDVTYMRMTRERWQQVRGEKKYERISFSAP